MKKALIGKKVGMTQLFDENGKVIPVTVIEAGPCQVVQKKNQETDGYTAVQMGYDNIAERKVPKPMKGHFAKAGAELKRHLREFRLEDCEALSIGDVLKADVFEKGERVDVTGISKGKGFAGVIKRWNFGRQKETHGVGPVHRSVGSLGACSTPSRVMRGKKMAGHMGVERVTVQNLDVVLVDSERNILAVRGAIPGPKGGIVTIKNTVKNA